MLHLRQCPNPFESGQVFVKIQPRWEVRISVYRKGRRVQISDALGDHPDDALYNAHNDLERWAEAHQESSRNCATFDDTP